METGPRLLRLRLPVDALVCQLYISAFFAMVARPRALGGEARGGHAQPHAIDQVLARLPSHRRGRRLDPGDLSTLGPPPPSMRCRRARHGPHWAHAPWYRHRLRGPPSKAPSGPERPAGRMLGRAILFFFSSRSQRRGVGDIPLNRRRGGDACMRTPMGRRRADAHTDKRETRRARRKGRPSTTLRVSSQCLPPLVAIFLCLPSIPPPSR